MFYYLTPGLEKPTEGFFHHCYQRFWQIKRFLVVVLESINHIKRIQNCDPEIEI